MFEQKQLQLEKIQTTKNASDMMTEALPKESCKQRAGLVVPSDDMEGEICRVHLTSVDQNAQSLN